jgi:DNA polymerase III subunit delta
MGSRRRRGRRALAVRHASTARNPARYARTGQARPRSAGARRERRRRRRLPWSSPARSTAARGARAGSSFLEGEAVCAQARDPRPEQLPEWLARRAARHRKRLSRAAATLVAERVEGNLLAAAQEIEKLCLLVDADTIEDVDVINAVTDSARFDVYQLVDALVGGDLARGLRVLRGLREEGTEPPLLTWALGRELRQAASMAAAIAAGRRLDQVLDEHRVWGSRKPLVRRLLERLDAATLLELLACANAIDAAAKGARRAAPWDELELLALRLCGETRAAAYLAPA